MKSRPSFLLCHVAFWFPLLFATPLFVALHNADDIHMGVPMLLTSWGVLFGAASWSSHRIARALPEAWYRRVSLLLLALAVVIVVQGNYIHGLFDYGDFNGQKVNWRIYGWKFWVEGIAFLVAIPLLFAILLRGKRAPRWLPGLLLVSSVLLLLPAVLEFARTPLNISADAKVDPKVFEFSSKLNLIHLLPDGFQGDVVREVLKSDPTLARAFKGFTFFSNHVGAFQSTAPSVPTILTGRRFNLTLGHSYKRLMADINGHSYQSDLARSGFRVDDLVLTRPYCIKRADSCVARSFNDLKPRGYFRYQNSGLLYSLAVIGDLTLFRHLPMLLKEKVYNHGNWLLSDTTLDGSSPFPDPVIREWMARMRVADDRPRYKWYHYIGTHIPPQWDAKCNFLRGLPRTRENYKHQARCVLTGIARFLGRLRELGIYEQTAMVITGDHGSNTPEWDMQGTAPNELYFHPGFYGTAQPAFMVKRLNDETPLKFSDRPTEMIDIAPTTLDLVGLQGDFPGHSALDDAPTARHTRIFQRYVSKQFWTGKPVPYAEYQVNGDARQTASWKLTGIWNVGHAPSAYPNLSYAAAERFTRGLSLPRGQGKAQQAWVRGSEFAFLITAPDTGFQHLVMQLHLDKLIASQPVKVRLNGTSLPAVMPPAPKGWWTTLKVPVDLGKFIQGNNFVKVEFSRPPLAAATSRKLLASVRSIALQ